MNKVPNIKNVDFCDFCEKVKVNKQIHTVYRIGLTTTDEPYSLGLVYILPLLDKYLFKKGIHLSGSQVVLLRPDVFFDFITKYPPEDIEGTIVAWELESADICEDCFKNYEKEVPLV